MWLLEHPITIFHKILPENLNFCLHLARFFVKHYKIVFPSYSFCSRIAAQANKVRKNQCQSYKYQNPFPGMVLTVTVWQFHQTLDSQ